MAARTGAQFLQSLRDRPRELWLDRMLWQPLRSDVPVRGQAKAIL